MTYVRGLVKTYGCRLNPAAEEAWREFEVRLIQSSKNHCGGAGRSLRLEAHRNDGRPSRLKNFHIDVARHGVSAHSSQYEMSAVTGVDEHVQAVVACQETTALCLTAALHRVETDDLHVFGFVCRGATHRSVACCFLLAAMAYPKALVFLTTSRTRKAAIDARLNRVVG